ncbi:serine/threonine-protein kinase [Actinomadura nitritigenes]|uniref:serine/threonine-protein kinase n=1 Tax=Actinomadura nitritigenes TaxID=134602 RepID=UPI003D91FC01
MAEDAGQLLVGRYRLSALLGQGGMGAVWRAHDERLGRDVAVKELRLPDLLDPGRRASWIARLDREARAAARLRHPGIITVHDLISGPDDRPWIVMELVHGPSLHDVIRSGGPLPAERAARIGSQILDALEAAHQAGVTHRDLKPANILLDGDRAVLTDFGIAALEGDATLTESGALLGTPAFMAPEQVRGLPATPESDLWSLGATLYTAVEGHPPFGGPSTGAVLVAIATEEHAPPLRAGRLEPALRGLLRKDPAERSTVGRLRAQLTAASVSRPPIPVTYATGPAPRSGRPVTHRFGRTAALVTGVAGVVALVALISYLVLGRGSTYDRNLHAARALGTPDGFRYVAATDIGSGRVRETFRGCGGAICNEYVTRLNWADHVTTWLKAMPGVQAVGGSAATNCISDHLDSTGCPIPITATRQPKLSNLRISLTPTGEIQCDLDIG